MDRQKIINSILIVAEVGLLCVVLLLGLFSGATNGNKKPSGDKSSEQIAEESEDTQGTEGTATEENWFGTSEERETFSELVEQKLSSMTTEQKVAQLFLITPEDLTGVSPVTVAGNGTKAALQKYPVGGLVYSAINFTGVEQANRLISGAQAYSNEIIGVPLFILVGEDASNYTHYTTIQNIPSAYTNSVKAVAAIKGGANMIYAPENFVELYEAVLGAVNGGTITQVRLENAVGSILTKKLQ